MAELPSATNELPLSALKFSSYSMSYLPEADLPSATIYEDLDLEAPPSFSPMATNEKPLTFGPLTPQPRGTTPPLRSLSMDDFFVTTPSYAGFFATTEEQSSTSAYLTSPFELTSFNFYQHERKLRLGGRIYSSSCDTSLHEPDSVAPRPRRGSASYAAFYSYPSLLSSAPVTPTRMMSDPFAQRRNRHRRKHSCDEITLALVPPPQICITKSLSFDDPAEEIDLAENLISAATPTNYSCASSLPPTFHFSFSYDANTNINQKNPTTHKTNTTTTTTATHVPSDSSPVEQGPQQVSGSAPTTSVTNPNGGGATVGNSESHATPHVRRQRHSIAGQMSVFKTLGFARKMATSTNSLFSTAVISGSSSAPNLRDMIASTASSGNVLSKFLVSFLFFCLGTILVALSAFDVKLGCEKQ